MEKRISAFWCGQRWPACLRQRLPRWAPSDAPDRTSEQRQLTPQEIKVQHAKVYLQLAEIELEQALQQNSQVAKVVPRMVVERLHSNVAVAQEQLTQAEQASTLGPMETRLRHAEERVRLAKANLETMTKAKEKGLKLDDLELKRLRLTHELAKLRLAMWNNPDNVLTLMDHMQWQIDRFGEEILYLDKRLTKLETEAARSN